MRLRLSPRARQDLGEIGRYVRAHSPAGALTVRAALQTAFATIREHPRSGRALGGGLHRLPVPRLPYLIFYTIEEASEGVLVITIRHGARDPASVPDQDT